MMKIGLAQLNSIAGDFTGNSERILAAYRDLATQGADLVVTPEFSLTGGPLLDLLFKADFAPRAAAALAALLENVGETPLIVGTILPGQNVAAILQKGQPVRYVVKQQLCDSDVSFESRYFQPAPTESSPIVEIAGKKVTITLGESLWSPSESGTVSAAAGECDLQLNLSASPFIHGRPEERFHALSRHAAALSRPVISCHSVGGNDSLIFDGTSLALDAQGSLIAQLPSFKEAHQLIEIPTGGVSPTPATFQPMEKLEALLEALTLGLRDYMAKSGFKSVILGLSGGIDSALAAAIAVRAIGAGNVSGITMPTHYSSAGSIDDSVALAENLGIRCTEIPITPAYDTLSAMFAPYLAGSGTDTTDENLQPRLRALTLMAFSNKFGHLVLSTGNKSELAVGYCTLYGDMAGGLALLSDLWKTEVYALSHYINREREIIPRSTLEKAPSAELRPNQTDQDTLPPYDILDAILSLSIEDDLPAEAIIARGFDAETVRSTLARVASNEYKRAQATLGLKVSKRAFGPGRLMPLVQRYSA